VAKRYDIYLGGVGFYLDPTERSGAYQKRPQEGWIGQESATSFWRTWAMRSFHGGERQHRILSQEDLNSYQYDTAAGLDLTSRWGETKLQPALASAFTTSTGGACPMVVTSDGTRVIVGLPATPFITIFYNGSWADATSVAGSGAVTDLSVAGTTIYAVRGGHVYQSTDNGANWTLVAGTDHTTAVATAYVNNKLVVLTSTKCYNQTDTEDIAAAQGGTCMCTHKEDIFWGQDRRLFRWIGRAWFEYYAFPPGFQIDELVSYRSVLWVLGNYREQGNYRGAVYGISQSGEAHLYSLEPTASMPNCSVRAAAGSDDEIFIANPQLGGCSRYDISKGGLTSGPQLNAYRSIPRRGIAYSDGYLVIALDNGSTLNVYVANLANPATYIATGILETPEYDFDFPNDLKLLRSIEVLVKPLTTGQTVAIAYSVDSGVSWTTAGTMDTVGQTSYEILPADIQFQELKLKVTLGAGATATTTPTLKRILAQAGPVSDAKWQWTLLAMADKVATRSGRPSRGYDRLAALETAHATRLPVTYIDRLGTTHEVVIEDFTETGLARSKRQVKLSIRLREV